MMPFLLLSTIHCGTSSPADFNSAALHAAQRLAHFVFIESSSAIHSGTSLPCSLRCLHSWLAHFILPLLASSFTIFSIQLGMLSLAERSFLISCFAHSIVACCCMRCFLCAQVRFV